MKLKLLLLAILVATGAVAGVSTASGTLASPTVTTAPFAAKKPAGPKTTSPPAFCSPCLFYSGDLNPNAVNSTALQNGNDPLFDGAVYQAITPDQDWLVKAIIVVEENGSGGVIDPTATPWEIRTGMGPNSGDQGTVYASGTDTATSTDLGTSFFFEQYAVKVTLSTPVVLHAGTTYFVNARPQCTNLGDSACTNGFTSRWFQDNVEPAGSPVNHYGPPNVDDDNFWNSTSFAANFIQAWPAPYPCFDGCDQFSVGLQGVLATGTLTVTKQLVTSAGDPGKFNLKIDGTTYASCVGGGGTTGPVTLSPGTYTVSETGCNVSLSTYTTNITCSDGSSGIGPSLSGVQVTAGGSTTCTIKNTRRIVRVS